MGARGKMGREAVFPFSFARSSLVAGVRLKACVFIGLAVHALIYILLIFKFDPFDLYRGACGGGRTMTLNRGLSLWDRGGPAGYSLTNRGKK
jgi:hypothetical protein